MVIYDFPSSIRLDGEVVFTTNFSVLLSSKMGRLNRSKTSTVFVTVYSVYFFAIFSVFVKHHGWAFIVPLRQDFRLSNVVLSLACSDGSTVFSSSTVWDWYSCQLETLSGCEVFVLVIIICSIPCAIRGDTLYSLDADKRNKDCANDNSSFVFFPTTFRICCVSVSLKRKGKKNKKFSNWFVRQNSIISYFK